MNKAARRDRATRAPATLRIGILAALGVIILAALAAMAPAGFLGWGDMDLVGRGQAVVQARLSGKHASFLTDPQGRTAVHSAGRADLRAVCGWVRETDAAWSGPRFFYVLFQRRLAWVSTETVFVQSHPGELSPGWGETWCRSPPIR